MKITVSPDGEVSFETEDVAQAAAMVAQLRNGAVKPKRSYRRRQPAPEPEPEEVVQVSPAAYEAWEWLCANDSSAGAGTGEVARGMGLKIATASWRLKKLKNAGLAHQTKRGFWRPGEAE